MARIYQIVFVVFALLFAACSRTDVVIYCSADQEYAEPILKKFEAESGLKVQSVFDIEANKTVGLVRTLIEEKSRPRCDVHWNNEIVHTLRLKSAGIYQKYESPSAAAFPAEYKDSDGMFISFAARARVFIINTNLVKKEDYPASMRDLADPKWKGRAGIARPTSGTALSHFAALSALWGDAGAGEFNLSILKNDVRLAAGNGAAARLVGDGELAFALVDTDDYESQRLSGKPVDVVYPDAAGDGTVILPNTVALVAGAPHADNGRKLIDYLLSAEVEKALAASPSANIPVRPGVEAPAHVRRLGTFRTAKVNFTKVAAGFDAQLESLQKVFVK